MAISSRGYPDIGADVHFDHPETVKMEPLCRNGSYHIKVTRDKSQVTCKACRKRLRGQCNGEEIT